jgi:hypothetical protein
MILAPPFLRVIEPGDRRVLGAFQFIDAVTELPIAGAAAVEVRRATLVGQGNAPVALSDGSIQIRQTRSGFHAVFHAPFFDAYTSAFENPPSPPELLNNPLRLRLAVTRAGSHYLPQEFDFDLPRSLDPADANNVFQPEPVRLFRAPAAPVLGSWVALRVRVRQVNTHVGLPGVLVRVFRGPRGAADEPIGQGMTEWRGDTRGEALVVLPEVPRFRPGAGNNVFETTQQIQFEVIRDTQFTGAANQLPDMPRILAGNAPEIITRPTPANPLTLLEPTAPVNVRAGEELTVRLEMP